MSKKRIDNYKLGMEYEELESEHFMALHGLDDKDKQIADLQVEIKTMREMILNKTIVESAYNCWESNSEEEK